ncbi:stage V sporulation protein B [Paenibacillus motobuensis]|uniref:stage V sporulation protein B n=1 Tax=Paenibacillus TaxID=44249 RepID=UPI00203DA0C4|nr:MULTISPECIES: stage V sporulation protein B [Paenibacillus]MCM3042174.1 stage V sporulation protein B [Paenibacillus lutimineralis]MCM3649278.1 stage V sporulation protein B [Paenibacillus motobuensis]
MNKQTFIQGTMILLLASVVNRILGFIPRIMLPRIIGTEGVGLYQLGYPFFLVIVTLIAGGIPLAIAKLVAEAESAGNPQRSATILRTSLVYATAVGFLFTFICLFGAPWASRYILTDPRVYHTFIAMSPMIVIVAVSSVYRGYFQGKQNMVPSAVSSVIETIARIVCVLLFSYLFLPLGIEYAAAGAMLGVVFGEIVGLAVLLWQYSRIRRKNPSNAATAPVVIEQQDKDSFFSRIWQILKVAIPVTGGRLVGSMSYLLESIITARSLAIAGVATAIATSQYGALQGMIIPLLLLPGALTSSLAISLVPSLAEAQAKGDMRTIHLRLHQSIRLALVTGAPFAAIMYVLAEPLCQLLYDNGSIAGMLKVMAPIALFSYVQAPLQATLQALDKPGRALINTLIGATVKLVLIYYLASNPSMGIYGAIFAIIINIVVVTILHGFSISRALRFRFPLLDILKVACLMIIMSGAAAYLYNELLTILSTGFRFIITSLIAVVIYLILSAGMKLIDWHDIRRIPILRRWIKN